MFTKTRARMFARQNKNSGTNLTFPSFLTPSIFIDIFVSRTLELNLTTTWDWITLVNSCSQKIPQKAYLVYTSISFQLVGWPQVYFASCRRILLQGSLTTTHNANEKIQKWVYDWWQSLPSEACGRKASRVIRWSWGMERRHGKGSFGTRLYFCFQNLRTHNTI